MCAGGSTDCMAIDYAISVNVQDFGIMLNSSWYLRKYDRDVINSLSSVSLRERSRGLCLFSICLPSHQCETTLVSSLKTVLVTDVN